MPNADVLRNWTIEEAQGSHYSIHPISTKMYHDLREVFFKDGLKVYIVELVAKCNNFQKVKAQHQKQGASLQKN